ncbi:MAG TPA: hypothetical protein VK797_20585 [Tepidisphaeraceae bacterium]|nr:hypothetical protein [Tepidisphaeraceae bacterium]
MLEYQTTRAFRKRRDLIGIASLPCALIHISLALTFRSGIVAVAWEAPLIIVVICCFFMALVFAICGIVSMRGKSVGGWTTLGIYAAIAFMLFVASP